MEMDGGKISEVLNLPIEFKFTTGTFIIVPPGPKGIGDRLEGRKESSSEYGTILGK